MAKLRGEGSVKRLGARYGRRVRARLAQVEMERKKIAKCPYCLYPKVRRLAAGIYTCDKCKSKFTGQAYSITKDKVKMEKTKSQKEMYSEMESSRVEEEPEDVEEDQEQ